MNEDFFKFTKKRKDSCEFCGKKFKTKCPYRIYCSDKCKLKAQKQKVKEYYNLHKKEILEYNKKNVKKWSEKNWQKKKEYQKKWYQKRKELKLDKKNRYDIIDKR